MTPFDTDFLSEVPNWLKQNTDDRETIVLSKSKGSTTLRLNMIGTIPRLAITFMLAVASTGVGGDSPQITGDARAVNIGMRDQADLAWEHYLSQLEEPTGRFTSTHVGAVRTVWNHFRKLVPNLAPPQTAPTEEGLLSMVWNTGEHHLEVDVAPNRKVEWFYLNRKTGLPEGKEGSLANYLPRRLDEIVKSLG